MPQQTNFAYWRQRIEETPDHDELNGTVLEAVEALMLSAKADRRDCVRLSDELLEYISRKQDLGEKKRRAMKALEPLSRIRQVAAKPRLVETEAAPAENFRQAFTDHFSAFLQSRLEPWRITAKRSAPLPFLFAPGFADVFEKAVREYIIPDMLENRRLALIAQDLNSRGGNNDAFLDELEKPIKENVVRHAWNSCWDNANYILFAEQKDGAGKTSESQEKKARQLLAVIKEGAAENNFDSPEPRDINAYQALFAFDPETARGAMKGIQQILRQETSEGHGREGSARQHLCGLINDLPDLFGEFLALWAYYNCADDFTPHIQNSFAASQGTSVRLRKRRLPFFFHWAPCEIQELGLS